MMMTQAAAMMPPDVATRVQTYRRVLLVSIVLNILIGIFILFWPDKYAEILNIPEAFPDTWPRHWGAQLLAINALYIPGYVAPLRHRYPNVAGIVIRLSFALFFFTQGGGFIWMGIYDGLFGLALLFTYRSALRANLLSKP